MFVEYMDNGKTSFSSRIATLQTILTLGDPLPHHILQEIDFPSNFNYLVCAILRLKGDTRCYKVLLIIFYIKWNIDSNLEMENR
jgi:hypothetical protein